MEKLETIILVTCFACVFAEFSGVMNWIKYKLCVHGIRYTIYEGKKYQKPMPPFDCAKCLSFWMGLVTFTIQGEGLMAIFYASVCMVLAIYIVRYAR